MFRSSFAALVLVSAVGAAAIKDATAGGYGSVPAADTSANYYQPPQQVVVPVPIFVNPPRPPLMSSHICAWDVGFATYGGKKHRSKRPTERTCDDAIRPGAKAKNNMANCDKCCKTTARLSGFTQNDVVGMILVVDERLRCTCCAPAYPVNNVPVAQDSGYGAAAPVSGYPAVAAPPASDYASAPVPAAAPSGY